MSSKAFADAARDSGMAIADLALLKEARPRCAKLDAGIDPGLGHVARQMKDRIDQFEEGGDVVLRAVMQVEQRRGLAQLCRQLGDRGEDGGRALACRQPGKAARSARLGSARQAVPKAKC